MKSLVSEEIALLTPYTPGKPVEELERELGIKGSIKLASNENPFGPSPKAITAIQEHLSQVHRYPDGDCYSLRRRLAERLGVQEEELVFGNGSNEIIELFVRTFLTREDEAVISESTFLVYRLILQAAGIGIRTVPLRDHRYDLDRFAKAIGVKTRALFIANPNNPTGTIVRREEWERLLEKVQPEVFIIMDEAYFEFVRDPEYPNSLDYRKKHPRLISLRTFSKVYGLAALRIGYGVCNAELAGYMNRVRQPFNVNGLAQVAATAALTDEEHVEKTIRNNREGIAFLTQEIEKIGLKPIPSQANFVAVEVGEEAESLYRALLKEGVIVRHLQAFGLPNAIRVTVGLPAENERFVKALRKVLGRG